MRTCPIRAQFEDLGAFCALGDYKDSVSYDGSVLADISSPVVPAIYSHQGLTYCIDERSRMMRPVLRNNSVRP